MEGGQGSLTPLITCGSDNINAHQSLHLHTNRHRGYGKEFPAEEARTDGDGGPVLAGEREVGREGGSERRRGGGRKEGRREK